VKELLETRWQSIRAGERRLATRLSVATGPMSPALLSRMSSLPPAATARALERLLERLILVRGTKNQSETISFSHPYLQQLARETLSPAARRRAYRRLGDIREEEGATPEELAFLFAEAKEKERAIRYGLEAAAAMREPGAAPRLKRIYESLLAVLPRADPRRSQIAVRLAEARSLDGDHAGAVTLLEKAVSRAQGAKDARSTARLLDLLAAERISLRQLERARQELDTAERLLQDVPESSEEQIHARLGLCRVELEAGNYETAMEVGRSCLARLAALPQSPRRDLLESLVLFRIGSLHFALGEFEAAIAAYKQSEKLLRDQGDLLEKGGLYCNLANVHTARGEYDQAVRYYERARRLAGRIGARDLEALVGANLGLQYLYRWNLPQAETAIRTAIRLAEGIGARRYVTFSRLCLGTMLIRRGDLRQAGDLLEEELRRARREGDHYMAVNLTYQLVKALLDSGELRRALSQALAGRRLARKLKRARSMVEGSLYLGVAYLSCGDFDRAVRYLEAARRSPGERHPHLDAEVLLYVGLARLRAGDSQKAETCLRRSMEAFRELKIKLRVCEARTYLASALARMGHEREARKLNNRSWRYLSGLPRDERPVILWAEVLVERAELFIPSLAPGDPALLDLLHELTEVRDLLRERRARRLQWQVLYQLAKVHRRLGDEENAWMLLAAAGEALEEVAQGLPPDLAALLRRTPQAAELKKELREDKPTDSDPPPGAPAGAGADCSLQERLRRLEESYRSLAEENRRLRLANEKLSSRVVTQKVELSRRDRQGRDHPSQSAHFCGLVGNSVAMQQLYTMIERVAATDLPVLVRGETGAGKDLVMRALHRLSARRRGPLVSESLSALPESLVESELFGHVEGAFSGAIGDRQGRLALADGGTLCLSDIDELSLSVQGKLLSALESGEVRPLGSSESRKVDFRLIASTRQDLRAAASKGRFREDLLYRIQGVELVVPPLRERRDDVPLLIDHFLDLEARRSGRRPRLEAEAAKRLTEYDWPGNVRELENEIRRLAILGSGRIRAADLAAPSTPGTSEENLYRPGMAETVSWEEARLRLDRAYFKEVLERCNGCLAEVARYLGIHERSVYKLRKRLGLG
jgi:DNA-binding NtrC family response regulator/tetratricopeptide (TPR) repeat protein